MENIYTRSILDRASDSHERLGDNCVSRGESTQLFSSWISLWLLFATKYHMCIGVWFKDTQSVIRCNLTVLRREILVSPFISQPDESSAILIILPFDMSVRNFQQTAVPLDWLRMFQNYSYGKVLMIKGTSGLLFVNQGRYISGVPLMFISLNVTHILSKFYSITVITNSDVRDKRGGK